VPMEPVEPTMRILRTRLSVGQPYPSPTAA
jgi:hypothetical protein